MLEPSYIGNKMGDTKITKIHHLITAEGFLSWKHLNLNLLIKVFLHTLATNINNVYKGRCWYSFILYIYPHIYAFIYLSTCLPFCDKKKIKVKFTTKQKCCWFPHKSPSQRRHFRHSPFVHQCSSSPVQTLLWRGHFLKAWKIKHWSYLVDQRTYL